MTLCPVFAHWCRACKDRSCASLDQGRLSLSAGSRDGGEGKRDWIVRSKRETGRARYVDAPGDKGDISVGDGKSCHLSILRRKLV